MRLMLLEGSTIDDGPPHQVADLASATGEAQHLPSVAALRLVE